MKMRTNKKSNLIPIIAGLVIVGLLATSGIVYASTGLLFGWKLFTASTQDTTGNNPASDDQIENGKTTKEGSLMADDKISGSDQPNDPVEQPDGRSLVDVDIISVNPIESIVRVSVMVSSLNTDGTCTISIVNSANTVIYTSTVGTQPQSSTSVCKGFDIPANTFSPGSFKIKVAYSSGNKYGNGEQMYVSN
jgi:hypothetical protein